MKRLVFFLIFFFCISPIFSQIVFESAEEAGNYAVANSENYTLRKLNATSSLNAANWSIQDFLPKFDVSWTEADNIRFGGPDSRNKTISMNMNMTLFDAGKKYISYKMNQAEKISDLYSLNIEIKSFKSSVISQYYSCLLLEKSLEVKKDLEKNTKKQLEIIEKEVALGLALENDYLEYLIAYRKIQDSLKTVERDLRTQYRVFKVLIGLEPESDIILKEDILTFDDYFYLESYATTLWQLLKSRSIELRRQETSLYYAQLQNKQNKLLFVPDISFQGGVSFSGGNYPLNNPTYSAKIVFSFTSNPFLPLSVSNDFGFNNKGKLTGATNAVSTSIVPQLNYKAAMDVQDIELRQKKKSIKDSVNSLYEQLFNQIASYDDSIDNIKRIEETVELQTKRLRISEKQVENGTMKRIDYLKQLEELAEQKISLLQSITSFHEITRTLEISLDIPTGGLKECLNIK